MRTCNRNGGSKAARQQSEQLGTLHQRNATLGRGDQFGIVRLHGGGVDYQLGVTDVFCRLRHHNGNAQPTHPREVIRFVDIRSGNDKALGM